METLGEEGESDCRSAFARALAYDVEQVVECPGNDEDDEEPFDPDAEEDVKDNAKEVALAGWHRLKTWPTPFAFCWSREKSYEVRSTADRHFEVGDFVTLLEFEPGADVFTGREIVAQITYVTQPGAWGLPPDVCVFAFRELARSEGAL